MNIYDTKSISCAICKQVIGEVDFDAEIIRPKCGQCANPTPHVKDKMPYLIYINALTSLTNKIYYF
ncbi:MAG: hypothetical protein OEL84_03940 [Nitrosopumilus sp.]|nr:hypothetical protein [Nitrosopumilus sp.]